MTGVAKRCTLKQIAEIVGVGQSTVSRVLNNSYSKVKITEETIGKIRKAVKEYGYEPNISARRLVKNKTFVLGLEIPVWSVGYHTFADRTLIETMRGIEEIIANSQYKLLLLFKNEKYLQTRENIKLLREKAIDGLLVWGASYLDSYAEEIAGYPVIFINSRPKGLKDVRYIGNDNFNASCEITEYAIAQGGRKFLYFSGGSTNSIDEERRNGFMAAMAKHKLPVKKGDFVCAGYRRQLAAEIMDRILSEGKLQFDTVVCANDNMAAGVYDAAEKHRMKIPDKFRLAGGEGLEAYDKFSRITTFKIDCFKMGVLAAQTLIDMVDGRENSFKDIYLKSSLLKRATV